MYQSSSDSECPLYTESGHKIMPAQGATSCEAGWRPSEQRERLGALVKCHLLRRNNSNKPTIDS